MAWAQRFAAHAVSAVLLANTIAERFSATTMLLPFADRYRHIRRPLITALALDDDASLDPLVTVAAAADGIVPLRRSAGGGLHL